MIFIKSLRTITLLLVEGQAKLCSGIMYSSRENRADIQHSCFSIASRIFFFFLNVFPPSPLKQRTKFLTHSENTLGFSCGADFLIFELTKRQIDCNFLGTKNFFYCPPFVKSPAQLYLVKYHCLVNPRFPL